MLHFSGLEWLVGEKQGTDIYDVWLFLLSFLYFIDLTLYKKGIYKTNVVAFAVLLLSFIINVLSSMD